MTPLIPYKRKQSATDTTADVNRNLAPIFASAQQAAAAPPALSAAQQAQQQQEAQRRAEAVRRQSRKPTDRNLPDDLGQVCIGDGVERYKRLRDIERKLDARMMQKRLDINEEIPSAKKREGVLRLWISNTAEGQPWQVMEEGGEAFGADGTFDFGENSQARYRVKIEGRLLPDNDADDDGDDEEENGGNDDAEQGGDAMDHDAQDAKAKKPVTMPLPNDKTRLSHFFKAITIDFDRPATLQPDSFSSIEWKKPQSTNPPPTAQQQGGANTEADFDVLEFERKSDEDMNVTINLIRDESPDRFKLSPALADLLDTAEDTRPGVVAGIWEYVRAFGLQEDEENRRIVCDERLRAVFIHQPTAWETCH